MGLYDKILPGRLRDKGGQVFDVRHPDFGAKGDGIADDSTAINAALTAAAAAGGGIVFLGSGTFRITTAVKLPNTSSWTTSRKPIRLRGAGRDCTKIKLAASAGGDVIQTDTFDTLWAARSTDGSWGAFVEDLTVDGNAVNAPGGRYGIAMYGWFIGLDQVDIINSVSHGLFTGWALGERTGLDLDTSMSGMFRSIRIHKCGGVGWYMAGPHDSFAIWTSIIHNDNNYALQVVAGGDGLKSHWLDIWGGAGHGARLDVAATLIDPQISTTMAKIGVDVYGGYAQIIEGIIAGNDIDVVLRGQNNRLSGRIEAANKGVQIAGLASGNTVDVTVTTCAVAFDFASDGGTNHVRAGVRTAAAGDVILTGSPVASTILDIEAQGLGQQGPFQQVRRLAVLDTALSAGNLALSAGWGTTRSVISIAGNDQRGRFTIAASGTGIAANPTITFTFNRAFRAAPNIVITTPGGTVPPVYIIWTAPTTTSVTITWIGTPTNGGNYTFEFICLG